MTDNNKMTTDNRYNKQFYVLFIIILFIIPLS